MYGHCWQNIAAIYITLGVVISSPHTKNKASATKRVGAETHYQMGGGVQGVHLGIGSLPNKAGTHGASALTRADSIGEEEGELKCPTMDQPHKVLQVRRQRWNVVLSLNPARFAMYSTSPTGCLSTQWLWRATNGWGGPGRGHAALSADALLRSAVAGRSDVHDDAAAG